MRLWHKDLIPVLPRQQLLGQWRECCLIAKNIAEKGSPNHMLVNKIMGYSAYDFDLYTELVYNEMINRGYHCDWAKYLKYRNPRDLETFRRNSKTYEIFKDWHTHRYLKQCFYNLQEKYDCGGISEKDFEKIKSCCCIDKKGD